MKTQLALGDALLLLAMLVWLSVSVGPWWVGVVLFLKPESELTPKEKASGRWIPVDKRAQHVNRRRADKKRQRKSRTDATARKSRRRNRK